MIDNSGYRQILIDESVEHTIIADYLSDAFNGCDRRVISSQEAQDRISGVNPEAAALPRAKRTILVTSNRGSFFKTMDCPADIFDPMRSRSVRFELTQGCPMDCHYCFCQQYLHCHHIVVYANISRAVEEYRESGMHGINCVTGDISDSLNLGECSIYFHHLLSDLLPELSWELRTKCALPVNWKLLSRDRFRIDWSVSPASQIVHNEIGTSSLSERLTSIATALQNGFHVGIRFDPLQPAWIDEKEYDALFQTMILYLGSLRPHLFVIGSYKMTHALKLTIQKRFPRSRLPGIEWVAGCDGKLRPFQKIRIASYREIISMIRTFFPEIPIVLSMEPRWVWQAVGLESVS